MKKGLFASIFFLILFSSIVSASLGISPAKKELNFVPGQKIIIQYSVFSDNPDKKLTLELSGELEPYATISTTEVIGGGTFFVTLDLPMSMAKPGPNHLGVEVKEEPPQNQFIGTAVNIISPVIVNVPYPGKYAEVSLLIPNGNVNEKIPVEVKVVNRGVEPLTLGTNVRFYDSNGDEIETMDFDSVDIGVGEEKFFRRFLDTNGYVAGNYIAEAVVKYGGEETRLNSTFRIGSLSVRVVNFTNELPKGGIYKFYVELESQWNSDLAEIYADVNFTKDGNSIFFRTPSIDLKAWQRTSITGYVDTSEMEGTYNTNVTLRYSGQQTSAEGTLRIKEGLNVTVVSLIVAGILVVLGIFFVIWRFSRGKKKR